MKRKILGIFCIITIIMYMNLGYVLAIYENTNNEINENQFQKENDGQTENIVNNEEDNTSEDVIDNKDLQTKLEDTSNNLIEEKDSGENDVDKEDISNNVIKEEEVVEENIKLKENLEATDMEAGISLLGSSNENEKIAKRTIKDGVYIISSALNNKKVLDIAGGSKANDANVQLWTESKVDQQKFKVTYLNNGYYKITSVNSSRVLDVAGAGTKNGTNVQQYESNETSAQQWIIKENENGYYSIISKCNGLYLDISYGVTTNGTNVQVYEKNDTKSQKFKFLEVEEFSGTQTIQDGIYTIKSALNESKVLDVSAASTNSGANIQIWSKANASQQKFIITYIGNGLYTIENLNSEKVLDVKGASTSNGANVQQYTKNNTAAQKWVIKDCGDGYYNIISRCGGLYLDIAYAVTNNGTNVQVYQGNGSKAQKFKFEPTNLGGEKTIESGTYIIASRLDQNRVLDVSAGSLYAGANIQLWDNAHVKQQRFLVTYLGNGFYQIQNVNSAKVLDVAGGWSSNGTNVQQYDSNNSKAQQWIIKEAGEKGYYNIISRCNELYLDVAFGVADNGANIQVYERNESKAQKFKFIKTETNGIDVSSYQGNINWASVKSNKIDFVIPRIGFRGYRTGAIVGDTQFEQNVKSATAKGIDCGGYFVTQAINYSEGVEEANWVLNKIKGYNLTCPIAIDVEWAGGGQGNNGRADNISKEERTQAIKGFCETIKNAGYVPMIYANKQWLTNYINMSELVGYNVWLAHYVKGAPEAKSDYTGNYIYWQYTSSGSCNGINGYVDLNKGY